MEDSVAISLIDEELWEQETLRGIKTTLIFLIAGTKYLRRDLGVLFVVILAHTWRLQSMGQARASRGNRLSWQLVT